jgi:cation:H+ antiporter
VLGRLEGALLLSIMVIFLTLVVRRESRRKMKNADPSTRMKMPALFFILGALGVVVGSRLLIYSGIGISGWLGISEGIIGFTMVAIGTSIPELATALISVSKKVPEISLGNILGANILNLGWVLGTAAMVNPLSVEMGSLLFSNLMMFGIMAALLAFMLTGRKLHRWEGATLLGIYGAYLVGLILL